MLRNCEDCGISYDDGTCRTICPHEPFISNAAKEQKDLAYSLIGKDLQFNHTRDKAPLHIQSIDSVGMVTLRELPGEFAPHLFKQLAD